MKNFPRLLAGIAAMIILASCTKNFKNEHYSFSRLVYETKAIIKENIESSQSVAIENPGKVYIKGGLVFMNDIGKGIYIIDYSHPFACLNKTFVNIPGCSGIAVKGNYMYADCFKDPVTVDIAGAGNDVQLKNYINAVFSDKYSAAGTGLDTKVKRETGVREELANSEAVLFSNPMNCNERSCYCIGHQRNSFCELYTARYANY